MSDCSTATDGAYLCHFTLIFLLKLVSQLFIYGVSEIYLSIGKIVYKIKIKGENMESKDKMIGIITIVLLAAALSVVGFNAYRLSGSGNTLAVAPVATGAAGNVVAQPGLDGPDVMPKGVPEIYGKELGVSYDDVTIKDQEKSDTTISKMGMMDNRITLSGKDKERYISIAGKISCEYCCGTESIIFANGEAACGCAHSFAMRGLAKYLITQHGSEFTDNAILEELGKWKTLFFPDKLTAKAKVLQQKGIELNYINIASNKYRGIENA